MQPKKLSKNCGAFFFWTPCRYLQILSDIVWYCRISTYVGSVVSSIHYLVYWTLQGDSLVISTNIVKHCQSFLNLIRDGQMSAINIQIFSNIIKYCYVSPDIVGYYIVFWNINQILFSNLQKCTLSCHLFAMQSFCHFLN